MLVMIAVSMFLLLMIGMLLIVKEVSERCEKEHYLEIAKKKFEDVAKDPDKFDISIKAMFDDCIVVYVIEKTPYYLRLTDEVSALKVSVSKLIKAKADEKQVEEAVKAFNEAKLKLEKFKTNSELGAVRSFTVDWR